jgi:hypothetical protein
MLIGSFLNLTILVAPCNIMFVVMAVFTLA